MDSLTGPSTDPSGYPQDCASALVRFGTGSMPFPDLRAFDPSTALGTSHGAGSGYERPRRSRRVRPRESVSQRSGAYCGPGW